MDHKEFGFDVETTGLTPGRDHILTLGGIVRINHKEVERVYIEMKPPEGTIIPPVVLDLTGLTIEQIRGFPSQEKGYKQLVELFGRYIDRFDKQDKLFTIGYNLDFDLRFLARFFKAMGDDYLFSFLGCKIDVLTLFNQFRSEQNLYFQNSKLETACTHFGIKLEAHNALSDIQATLELYDFLTGGKK